MRKDLLKHTIRKLSNVFWYKSRAWNWPGVRENDTGTSIISVRNKRWHHVYDRNASW